MSNNQHVWELAKKLFAEQKATDRLDGWLFVKEIEAKYEDAVAALSPIERKA